MCEIIKVQYTVVLLLALFVLGCEGLLGKPASDIPDLYVGKKGIDAGFVPESVPSTILDSSTTEVILLVRNKGVFDADPANTIVTVGDTKGVIKFQRVGVRYEETKEQNIMASPAMTLKDLGLKLPGRLLDSIGSEEGVGFTILVKRLGENEEKVSTALSAKVCYAYNTLFSGNVCIDASSTSFKKQRKPCDPDKALSFSGQGSPVAVKKIETVNTKSGRFAKPAFKIYVGNIGNGLVVDRSSLGLFCTADDINVEGGSLIDKTNVVVFESVKINGHDLVADGFCSDVKEGTEIVEKKLSGRLANDFIVCEYNYSDLDESLGAFVTPLEARLSYGYAAVSEPVPLTVQAGSSRR